MRNIHASMFLAGVFKSHGPVVHKVSMKWCSQPFYFSNAIYF